MSIAYCARIQVVHSPFPSAGGGVDGLGFSIAIGADVPKVSPTASVLAAAPNMNAPPALDWNENAFEAVAAAPNAPVGVPASAAGGLAVPIAPNP